jgi:xylulokinase
MTPTHVLGIDVGTNGTRAVIIDCRGQITASATAKHNPFVSPEIGWAEQDPQDWWRACGIAVRNAMTAGNIHPDSIVCIGFSGQMHGAVMLDERDDVVRPALIWCDVRTEKQSEELDRLIGRDEVIQLTCNRALPNFTLTKFLWVREDEPDLWAFGGCCPRIMSGFG